MKRIGVAFSPPWGPTQRRFEYGIYEDGTCRYEGYRETRPDGEAMVGLPLSGPNAAHMQPVMPFVETHYAEVRYFGQSTPS